MRITLRGARQSLLVVASAYGAALALPCFAQVARGDIAAGHTLAEKWCSECHAVEPKPAQSGDAAPSFAAIAKLPSTTLISVQAWLQTPHPRMPDLQLTRQQIDDIDAYILSLKGTRGP